jgi:hypothetical protein
MLYNGYVYSVYSDTGKSLDLCFTHFYIKKTPLAKNKYWKRAKPK